MCIHCYQCINGFRGELTWHFCLFAKPWRCFPDVTLSSITFSHSHFLHFLWSVMNWDGLCFRSANVLCPQWWIQSKLSRRWCPGYRKKRKYDSSYISSISLPELLDDQSPGTITRYLLYLKKPYVDSLRCKLSERQWLCLLGSLWICEDERKRKDQNNFNLQPTYLKNSWCYQ